MQTLVRIAQPEMCASDAALAAPRESSAEPPVAVPEYLAHTYRWAYLDPRNARLLDQEFVVNIILWGNYSRLVRAVCREFRRGEHVLQAASVYGSQPQRLAEALGPTGRLMVNDISELQVARQQRRLAAYPNAAVRLADTASPGRERYDAACCFFLLHEMPDHYKRRVVNALLGQVKPGGRVVFVDYARPLWFHPLRGVMALVNRWLEPYAESLWNNSIASFAANAAAFRWTERRLFLGLYQLVVAQHLDCGARE